MRGTISFILKLNLANKTPAKYHQKILALHLKGCSTFSKFEVTIFLHLSKSSIFQNYILCEIYWDKKAQLHTKMHSILTTGVSEI